MDSNCAVKERDSRFTQNVDGVSTAAVQYGHDQATLVSTAKLRRSTVPRGKKHAPLSVQTTEPLVWKKANEVASEIATTTFDKNPDDRELAGIAKDPVRRRKYIKAMIVRVDRQTVLVYNSPAHAAKMREIATAS